MTADFSSTGLEAAFLEHRDKLVRFLRARGAGEAAEDLVQEIWLKIAAKSSGPRGASGPIASPLSYLFRTADLLMIDRFRSERQASVRDRAWSEVNASDPPGVSSEPSVERRITAAQEAADVLAVLDGLGPRVAAIFRHHRIEGTTQKAIAAKMGLSLSTVESDLRIAYRALTEWKERAQ